MSFHVRVRVQFCPPGVPVFRRCFNRGTSANARKDSSRFVVFFFRLAAMKVKDVKTGQSSQRFFYAAVVGAALSFAFSCGRYLSVFASFFFCALKCSVKVEDAEDRLEEAERRAANDRRDAKDDLQALKEQLEELRRSGGGRGG